MPTDAGDTPASGGPPAPGTPIVATDADGTVTGWNDAAARTFGWDATEVCGEPCPLEAAVRDDESHPAVLGGPAPSTVSNAEITNRPVTVTARDGEILELRLSQAPLERDGELAGLVATFTGDSAAEREAERLRQTAGVIAHDLRGPLNAAMASLSLLEAGEDGETGADGEHVARAERCLDRIAGLVEDLHEAGTNESGSLDPQSVSLARFADAAWHTTETGGATLAVEDATITADPAEFQKVLANLFANAVDHGGDAVRVGPLADGGFYVEDDGPGVAPEDRDEVFTFGYSGTSDGTGYGLTIVRRIADAHGWTVTLSESDDGGARFEFST